MYTDALVALPANRAAAIVARLPRLRCLGGAPLKFSKSTSPPAIRGSEAILNIGPLLSRLYRIDARKNTSDPMPYAEVLFDMEVYICFYPSLRCERF
jgi:hypothetical protein